MHTNKNQESYIHACFRITVQDHKYVHHTHMHQSQGSRSIDKCIIHACIRIMYPTPRLALFVRWFVRPSPKSTASYIWPHDMHHASCIMHHASCIMHHASCI